MGYFSRLAVQLAERQDRQKDHSYISREDRLELMLMDIKAMLSELEEIRPHDPLDPLYDRYFYEDYIVHYNEFFDFYDSDGTVCYPGTVEGLLRAIREIEEKLDQEREARLERLKYDMSIFLTGADPDGQCVLVDAFEPAPDSILHIAA
jgi:hypothetical protein